ALVDRQALEVPAQAVEAELDRAEANPLAAAENPAPSRCGVVGRRDGERDGAAEGDPVGALVEGDQDGQRVARAGLSAGAAGAPPGHLGGPLPARGGALEPHRRPDLVERARNEAAAEPLLRAGEVREAGRDLPAGEGLHDGQRRAAALELAEDHALERL